MKKLLIILALVPIMTALLGNISTAQEKYEKETGINQKFAPKNAVDFIDKAFSDIKIKWYKEFSKLGITFEAKTKFNKKFYSIEFDTLGKVQDVEYIVEFKQIKPDVLSKIKHETDSLFVSYKVQKTQIHYEAEEQILLELIKTDKSTAEYLKQYEIVLFGKKNKHVHKYEILFDSEGRILQIFKFVEQNTSNIVY